MKAQNGFFRTFFCKILTLCKVSIQERFLIKSARTVHHCAELNWHARGRDYVDKRRWGRWSKNGNICPCSVYKLSPVRWVGGQKSAKLGQRSCWMNPNWNVVVSRRRLLSLEIIFLARVLAKALKMLFWLCNLLSQIFHFFHIFNFWWNNHWNISSDFQSSIFFDQIESDLSKMDQTWSNWIFDEIIIEIYHQIFRFFFDQIESDLSKMDQNGSKLINLMK